MTDDGRLIAAERLLDERLDENGVALSPEMLKLIRELKVIIKEQNAKIAQLEETLKKVGAAMTGNLVPVYAGVAYDLNKLIKRLKLIPREETDMYYWDAMFLLEWELERMTIYKQEHSRWAIENAYHKYTQWKRHNLYWNWANSEWQGLANSTGAILS